MAKDTSKHFVTIKQNDFLLRIQPDDILGIDIGSKNPSLSAPLNLSNVSYLTGYNGSLTPTLAGSVQANINSTTATGMRVDRSGDITFIQLGKVHVAGLTLPEIRDKIEGLVKASDIKDPLVKVQLLNFRINVMGEVNRAGTYIIDNRDKYSILDALNQAGDMTVFGNRNDVMLLRDSANGQFVYHFDLTNTSAFNSNYFYLKQNDIIYVSPTKQKAVGTNAITNQIINYSFTSLSLISSVISLIYILRNN